MPEKTTSSKLSPNKTRPKNGNTLSRRTDDELFLHSVVTQKHVARATALKIDDIEREMTRDMIPTKSAPITKPSPTTPAPAVASAKTATPAANASPASAKPKPTGSSVVSEFASTMALDPNAGDSIVFSQTLVGGLGSAETASVPILEEAAILFASGQSAVAEHMLLGAVRSNSLGKTEQIAWFMLFDLYQVANNATAFESLAIDYARKFETSPPNWHTSVEEVLDDPITIAGSPTTTIAFMSKLNGDITKHLDKIQTAIKDDRQIRLDFNRVKEVDPIGCGLLLRSLQSLKKAGSMLTLIGAQNLADRIKATIEVGRRDDTEISWLLLLEILQLMHLETTFEETSIEYCITFEVSPPSFEAPKSNITTAMGEMKLMEEPSDRFAMPKIIDGNTDILTRQIAEHAKTHNPVILDCATLDRVEFGASAQLLNGLVPISSQKETTIQFQDVNYLVLMLFNAMGLKNVATISPRKH